MCVCVCVCVCVDILTFNKEKKNYYYFSIYIEKNIKQDSQKCRYIMPFTNRDDKNALPTLPLHAGRVMFAPNKR